MSAMNYLYSHLNRLKVSQKLPIFTDFVPLLNRHLCGRS